MRNFIILIASMISVVLMGCGEHQVGYLRHDSAEYRPDSLIIRATLNPADPEDSVRIAEQEPWQSSEIDGVQGSAHIYYGIADVRSDNGYDNAKSQFTTVGKGIIQVEYNHTLPVGKYVVDIEIWNEGNSVIKNAIYKVIVE